MQFQGSLFEAAPEGAATLAPERTQLSRGAWLDVQRSWLPDADEVFATLVREVPWRAERRQMYDRLVDIPRLTYTYMIDEELPHPALTAAREALSEHYLPELGEPFRTAGCCYYRDGRDSVAWHGDTIGRGSTQDTMVAIVSVGDPRRLTLRPRREAATQRNPEPERHEAAEPQGRHPDSPRREAATQRNPEPERHEAAEPQGRHPDSPRGGGESMSVEMGHGDLLVMGGSCQRTWEHAVPKVASAGPRLSVQFRPFNVF